MKGFDQAKADAVKMLETGPSILTFCSIECRIDWFNGVNCVKDRGLYGCWQCGEDLLQGLLMDKPMDDDNAYRRRREQS
ncbi:hypothetical protein LCGC14_2080420 [marine sediment metagenome]|uniref:Uncharacterized protein n=1 Tax=marine sediment metagenome TaxID=412755 RepID=A0A0F9EFN3_9ZZZZ